MTRQQLVCSQFLRRQGFLCPEVVPTSKGEMLAQIANDRYSVLLTMLPGKQLGADKSKLTTTVLFELGVLLASMHHTLQEFSSQHLDTDPNNPWSIKNCHLLSQYLHCIKDEEEKQMLAGIIAKFQQIRDMFHLLNKGVIHGDFHDYNLIVDWSSGKVSSPSASSTSPPSTLLPAAFPSMDVVESHQHSILQKYGIIDFEEMSHSYRVLELSRLIADMMIDCSLVDLEEIGGHIVAGYCSVSRVPVEEFRFSLYETALTCLVQNIVLSIHEYQFQGESNEYCLLSTEDSRVLLKKLKGTEPDEVYRKWGDVMMQYGQENLFT